MTKRVVDWKTAASRYPEQPDGLLPLEDAFRPVELANRIRRKIEIRFRTEAGECT